MAKRKINKGKAKVAARTGRVSGKTSNTPQEAPRNALPIGQQIDNVVHLDMKIDALMSQVKALEKQREPLVTDLLVALNAEHLTSSKGKLATAYINKTRHPTVKDWAEVENYVYKYKAFDLFQRRITSTAYFDRISAGETIKGVEVFEKVDVRFKPNRE